MDDLEPLRVPAPLFRDRRAAGRELVPLLERERADDAVVVGLARGGVVVADEVARALQLPLDAVAVRKLRHPWAAEYAIGAVAPHDGVYVRARDGLTDVEIARALEATMAAAAELDARLHADVPAADLDGRSCLLVDDGLATGATMIAAARWARSVGARRVVAAAPVGAAATVALLEPEADAVVCPHTPAGFLAVGVWYAAFDQVDDEDVVRLLAGAREPSRA